MSETTFARPPERLPPVEASAFTPEQKQAAEAFKKLRGVEPTGPFCVLIRSPELLDRVQALGEFLRYRCSLSGGLSEFVILMVARLWTQDYEWQTHAPIALKQGVSQEIVDAIADGRRPRAMSDQQETAYDFFHELAMTKRVSDTTYARAAAIFGETGVVELAGLIGYYSMLATVMNVARTRAPQAYLTRFPE